MNDLLAHPAQWLLTQGLSMFVQSSMLVMLLVVVEGLAGRRLRPALRHGLWLLVLVKLLVPPMFTVPTGFGYWIGAQPISPRPGVVVASASSDAAKTDRIVALSAPASAVTTRKAPAVRIPSTVLTPRDAALWVWVAGSLALGIAMGVRYRRISRLIARAVPVGQELDEVLRRAAAEVGLGRIPVLKLTDACHSPAVHGSFRPVILMPSAMAAGLSPDTLRGVLLHELVHVRRRDLWVQWLQVVVQVLWWWNPAMWLATSRLRTLRELAVDEEVQHLHGPGRGHVYPGVLVEVARFVVGNSRWQGGLVGVVESGCNLRRRVEHLVSNPTPASTRLGPCSWAVVLLLGLVLIPIGLRPRAAAEPPRAGGFPRAGSAEPMEDKSISMTPIDLAEALTRVLGRPVDFASPSDLAGAMRGYLVSQGLEVFRDPLAGRPALSEALARWARVEEGGKISARLTEAEMERLEQVLGELMQPGLLFNVCQVFEIPAGWGGLPGLTSGLEARPLAVRTNGVVAALTIPQAGAAMLRSRLAEPGMGKRRAKACFMAGGLDPGQTEANVLPTRAQQLFGMGHMLTRHALKKDVGLAIADASEAFAADPEVPKGHLLLVVTRAMAGADGAPRQLLYLVEPRW
jgi:beta-lactamase regulating signal transducer with metallopeptidase domain